MVKGQTTIELFLLLVISVLALSVIFTLYSNQLSLSVISREQAVAKNTVQKIVNSANSLYTSGAGSKSRFLIEMPEGSRISESPISGKTVSIMLSNGEEVFASAEVNFSGDWKKVNGVYVKGAYYVTLFFDGNSINILYDDFELSNGSIHIFAKQDSVTPDFFTVRNSSSFIANFLVSVDYSKEPFSYIQISSEDINFNLLPGETRVIDFNLIVSSSAVGNYSGKINILGNISNGVTVDAINKSISVSVEVAPKLIDLVILPKSLEMDAIEGHSELKSFSICNSSSNDISGITWTRDSNKDANMLSWFSWPLKDVFGDEITSVNAMSCKNFDLNITVPIDVNYWTHDANFTALLSDGNSVTVYLYVSPISSRSVFITSKNDFDTNTNWSSSKFMTANSRGRVAVSGALDWNFSSVGEEFGRGVSTFGMYSDPSLVGVWHFNGDANDYKGTNHGSSTCVYSRPYLGANSCFFYSSSNSVTINPSSDLNTGVGSFSFSLWAYHNDYNYPRSTFLVKKSFPNCHDSGGRGFDVGHEYASGGINYCIADGSNVARANLVFDPGYQPNDFKNKWTHFVLVFDRELNKFRVYVNGVRQSNEGDIGSVVGDINNNSPLYFNNMYGWYQDGYLDEVLFFKRVLTDSEVEEIYNSQKHKWVDPNLVTYYKFDEKFLENGVSKVIDSSPNGNDGVLYNGADVNEFGVWDSNGLYVNGVDSYFETGPYSSLNLRHRGTVSMWVKPLAFSELADVLVKGGVEWKDNCYSIVWANNRFYGNLGDGNVALSTNGPKTSVLELGKWYYISFVWDTIEGFTRIYRDGVLEESFSTTITPKDINVGLTIGRNHSYNDYYFNGIVDEVKIYSRALSAEEVSADYNSFLGSKYVSSGVVLAPRVNKGFLSLKINSENRLSFGHELGSDESSLYGGLVGLWHLNDRNSDGWVLNSVTGVMDGWLVNGADTNAKGLWDSNAAHLFGLNDYISVGAFAFPSSASFSVWFKSNQSGGPQTLFSGANVFCYVHDNNIKCSVDGNSDGNPVFGGGWHDGNWHNLVLTTNGVLDKAYVDGEFSAQWSETLNGSSASYEIGGRNAGGDNYIGVIDEVAFWDRELSYSEVRELFIKGVTRLDLNFYSCGDSSCSAVLDYRVFDKIKSNYNYSLMNLIKSNYFKYSVSQGYSNDFSWLSTNQKASTAVPFFSDVNLVYSG